MRVGIEISSLFHATSMTGIPRVVKRIIENAPKDVELSFLGGDKVIPFDLATNIQRYLKKSPGLSAWAQSRRRVSVEDLQLDHVVYPSWRLGRKLARRETTILHDLTPLSHPEFHLATGMTEIFSKYVLSPIDYNDRIVCVSRSTQLALSLLRPDLATRTLVAHLGVDDATPRVATNPSDRRFICVGSLEPCCLRTFRQGDN
jgi:hypothetical protein